VTPGEQYDRRLTKEERDRLDQLARDCFMPCGNNLAACLIKLTKPAPTEKDIENGR